MSNGAHVLISLEDNGWNSGTFNVPVDTIGLQCPTGMDYKVGATTTTTIKVECIFQETFLRKNTFEK